MHRAPARQQGQGQPRQTGPHPPRRRRRPLPQKRPRACGRRPGPHWRGQRCPEGGCRAGGRPQHSRNFRGDCVPFSCWELPRQRPQPAHRHQRRVDRRTPPPPPHRHPRISRFPHRPAAPRQHQRRCSPQRRRAQPPAPRRRCQLSPRKRRRSVCLGSRAHTHCQAHRAACKQQPAPADAPRRLWWPPAGAGAVGSPPARLSPCCRR